MNSCKFFNGKIRTIWAAVMHKQDLTDDEFIPVLRQLRLREFCEFANERRQRLLSSVDRNDDRNSLRRFHCSIHVILFTTTDIWTITTFCDHAAIQIGSEFFETNENIVVLKSEKILSDRTTLPREALTSCFFSYFSMHWKKYRLAQLYIQRSSFDEQARPVSCVWHAPCL